MVALPDFEGALKGGSVKRSFGGLSRYREALRMAQQPDSEVPSEAADFALLLEADTLSYEDRDGLEVEPVALSGKSADLILLDDSCFDLAFTLPAAPLPELDAMIRNEILRASPFREEDSKAFWRADETESGDWRIRVGVVLKSELKAVQEAMHEHSFRLHRVVRLGPSKGLDITTGPDWLEQDATGPAFQSHFPKSARLPAVAIGVFVLSLVAHTIVATLSTSDLKERAFTAEQQVRMAAAEVGFRNDVQARLSLSQQNIDLLATLSAQLPDETWLDRLAIEKDGVRVIGFGPSGAETIRLLSGLEGVENVRFASPVTRDNSQNIERFVIEFDLVRSAR